MSNVIDFLLCIAFGLGLGIGLYVVYALAHLPKYFERRREVNEFERIKMLASFIDPSAPWSPPKK